MLFFYDGKTFVVVHQGYFIDNGNADRDIELLFPKVNDISFDTGGILFIDNQSEGDAAIFAFDHLVCGDRLACRAVVLLKEANEIMYCITLSVGTDITLALTTHDSCYFSVMHFDKVLSVVADEGVGKIPKIGADHMADSVGDGMVIVVEYLDNAVVLCDVVAVVFRGLVAVGGAFAAIRIDDIATESFLNFGAESSRQRGAGGHHMKRLVTVVIVVIISILCQQIKRNGIGADDGGSRVLNLVQNRSEHIVAHRVERYIETVVYLVL